MKIRELCLVVFFFLLSVGYMVTSHKHTSSVVKLVELHCNGMTASEGKMKGSDGVQTWLQTQAVRKRSVQQEITLSSPVETELDGGDPSTRASGSPSVRGT